jgi:hypothetical protein
MFRLRWKGRKRRIPPAVETAVIPLSVFEASTSTEPSDPAVDADGVRSMLDRIGGRVKSRPVAYDAE